MIVYAKKGYWMNFVNICQKLGQIMLLLKKLLGINREVSLNLTALKLIDKLGVEAY